MHRPITDALIKIFAKGFYKEHSGFLLFLFVVIFSHLFWMKPLGGHLSPEESIYYHLILLISFARDPMMMIFYFIIWLIYSIKSWSYIEKQLKINTNQFLFYSITSLPKFSQLQCWFWVQGIILLPAGLFGLAAIMVGMTFQYFILPIIILIYLFLLTGIGAIIYVWLLNRSVNSEAQSFLLKISTNWKKPFFSLFIYYVFDKMKLGYLFTKFLSWASIAGGFLYFFDFRNDFRVAGIVTLLVTIIHTFLIYQSQRFESVYLTTSRNLPYPRFLLFINFAIVYLFLIMPEIIWIIFKFNLLHSVELLSLSLSIALSFRSLAYHNSPTINKYIKNVFAFFILYFLMIMFGFLWMIPLINFPLSYIIFYKSYYTYEPVLSKN